MPRVETVRDVLSQTLAWRLAYEQCAAQVRCVAAWVQAASVGQLWSPQMAVVKRPNEASFFSFFRLLKDRAMKRKKRGYFISPKEIVDGRDEEESHMCQRIRVAVLAETIDVVWHAA